MGVTDRTDTCADSECLRAVKIFVFIFHLLLLTGKCWNLLRHFSYPWDIDLHDA